MGRRDRRSCSATRPSPKPRTDSCQNEAVTLRNLVVSAVLAGQSRSKTNLNVESYRLPRFWSCISGRSRVSMQWAFGRLAGAARSLAPSIRGPRGQMSDRTCPSLFCVIRAGFWQLGSLRPVNVALRRLEKVVGSENPCSQF